MDLYRMTLKTAPAVEPLTLQEVKQYLNLEINDGVNALDTNQMLAPAVYAPGSYTGTGVEVLGYIATVHLDVGLVAATGTLLVSLQESDDNIIYTAVEDFILVTPANDNAGYEIAYSGLKRYIRVVSVVSNASAIFGISAILNLCDNDEDASLTNLIKLARQYCEKYQNRAYITQTWQMMLDYWPRCREIEIPYGNLISIDLVTYKSSDGTITTLTNNTDYVYSTHGIKGRLTPAYGRVWPPFVPFPLDAVTIEFKCGYGATAASVPENVKSAMKYLIAQWYTRRLPTGDTSTKVEYTVDCLLNMGGAERIWPMG